MVVSFVSISYEVVGHLRKECGEANFRIFTELPVPRQVALAGVTHLIVVFLYISF